MMVRSSEIALRRFFAGSGERKGVRRMELTIKGEAKEIAALVLELQERRGEELPNYIPASSSRD